MSQAEIWLRANRGRLKEAVHRLSISESLARKWDWRHWGRPSQLPPGDADWVYWMLLAGRGSGKTRAGAEWVRMVKERCSPLALVGPTAADVRDVMIRGPAGLLAIAPPDDYPDYQPSNRRLSWRNGAYALLFSAEEPDRLRGPQVAAAWCDELAAWQYPDDAWSNLSFGLRMGPQPRACVTTTPRPIKLIRELLDDPLTRVSRTSSYHNRMHLAPAFYDKIIQRYEGTRLGRQEIYGELLEDVPGALWTHEIIERDRLRFDVELPPFVRIVVAIDPAMTSGEDADETGIVVAAKDGHGHAYVLQDVSGHYQPTEWAQAAVAAFHNPARHADLIVAEINNGGEMVELTVRMVDNGVPFKAVHASRGKVIRAEPVSALYEQGRVHHVGTFGALEDQMTSFTVDWDRAANGSPDRVDALVWAVTELIIEESAQDYWAAWAKW